MTTELIERVARDTDHLDNRAAWQEIQARLKAAGVPKGQLSSVRDSVWFERRRYAATMQAPRIAPEVSGRDMEARLT